MNEIAFVFPVLVIIAFLYGAVGHGGASGYLAIMAIFSFQADVMRPTALVLNIFVSTIAFISFSQKGYFAWRRFLPFAVASIPMAYIGGQISINENLYKIILGVLLLVATARMIIKTQNTSIKQTPILPALAIGGIIGFFSGLIGIGGGIILSPVILLLGWGNLKQTAAVSSLFILVNSVSGLIGQYSNGLVFSEYMWWMVICAVIGGGLGAWWGAHKGAPISLKRVLALVLIVASVKLIAGI